MYSWNKYISQIVLTNQTWVCSLPCCKTNLLTPGCGEGKNSIYCKAPDKESRVAYSLKAWTPWWVSGKKFLTAKFGGWGVGGRAAGCVIHLWLVGDKVMGWCSRNPNHQLSGSNQSGVQALWSAWSYILPCTSPWKNQDQAPGCTIVSFCIPSLV